MKFRARCRQQGTILHLLLFIYIVKRAHPVGAQVRRKRQESEVTILTAVRPSSRAADGDIMTFSDCSQRFKEMCLHRDSRLVTVFNTRSTEDVGTLIRARSLIYSSGIGFFIPLIIREISQRLDALPEFFPSGDVIKVSHLVLITQPTCTRKDVPTRLSSLCWAN